MSMFSTNFFFCQGSQPSYADLIGKVESVVDGNPGAAYTLDRLSDIINPPSLEDLALALAALVSKGKLKRFIRLESPVSRGGIGDYESLDSIPDRVYDSRQDLSVDVTADMMRVLYTSKKTP